MPSAGEVDTRDWLRLALTPGLGNSRQRALLDAFGLPASIMGAGRSASMGVVGEVGAALFADDKARDALIEQTLAWLAEADHHLVTLGDQAYPQRLLHLPDPPIVLYVHGQLAVLERPALAVVGSRNCTPGGSKIAREFSRDLAQKGLVIVSGLALGIDAAAHRGALDAGGATIAVVGTGIDRIYPARNRELGREIVRTGVMLSEFPLGTPATGYNFPRRNRLIAALSQGVLVVEAALQSGSLITARLAGEIGREVMAIPGSIHSPLSRGCHQLLRQGARLVESTADILEELGLDKPPTLPESSAGPVSGDAEVLLTALGFDPVDVDTLLERSGLTAEAALAMLSELELDGLIAAVPGGRFQRLS